MPSLKDAIANAKLPNYVPVPSAPMAVAVQPPAERAVNYMRFILPPFNTDPDSVRLADSPSPKIRIWPRPQQQQVSNTTATSTATSATSSASAATVTLSPKTATLTTGVLPAGTSFITTVQMAESFQLLAISANVECEVRMYGTQQSQIADSSRAPDAPVAPEITQNMITSVALDTLPFVWGWQNRMGANQNTPQTSTIYVTVFNINPSTGAAVTVSIEYLPLE